MEKNLENCIEWLTGEDRVTLSITSRKHITKIKRLSAKDDDCDFEENSDGSIVAHVPISYIKISPKKKIKRELSDEQRAAIRARFVKGMAALNEDK